MEGEASDEWREKNRKSVHQGSQKQPLKLMQPSSTGLPCYPTHLNIAFLYLLFFYHTACEETPRESRWQLTLCQFNNNFWHYFAILATLSKWRSQFFSNTITITSHVFHPVQVAVSRHIFDAIWDVKTLWISQSYDSSGDFVAYSAVYASLAQTAMLLNRKIPTDQPSHFETLTETSLSPYSQRKKSWLHHKCCLFHYQQAPTPWKPMPYIATLAAFVRNSSYLHFPKLLAIVQDHSTKWDPPRT